MRKRIQKTTGTFRRGIACAMAAALALSSLAQAPSSEAAGKKKPTLSVKKKTLYWNKSGSKNYTLKLKKNKVKTLVKTTWKTSKKSVVALSRKKDTSVRLTAKKKGTATITAAVKYVPMGKWSIRTAKLTCKVTSKEAAPAKTPPVNTEPAQTPLIIYTTMPAPPSQPVVTEDPADTPEPADTPDPDRTPGPGETADPDKSQEPTSTPDIPDDSTVTEVDLSAAEALLSMEQGRNTIVLTATAKDKNGNSLDNQTITWTSDNENVAAVKDGIVTAAGDGTAHITATVNNVTSQPCTVTVDTKKPFIESAELSDGRTFFVAFSEPVTGTPSVTVKTKDNTRVECASQTLSANGTSLVITCRNALSAGIYELTVNGLEDPAGNKMEENSRISVERETSDPKGFLCKTEQVPAGQSSFNVYFSVVDQYGEEYGSLDVISKGTFTASAQTENGMPFKAQVNQQEGYVRVSGSASAFTEGRKIKIALTYSVSDKKVIEETMTITLVDASDIGKAVKIAGLNATSKTMDNISGSADKPVFQLSGTEKENVFTLSSKLLDKFGYEADPSDVTYKIEDGSILAFSDTDGSDSDGISTSSQPVTVRALKGGTTTITAYLASDDSESFPITVTIKSTNLREITVADPGDGTNGKMSEAKITLTPAGTGLTEDDLEYRVTEGAERLKELVFVQESDGIYINITAATDGSDAPIRFVVCSDGIESEEITYKSTPSLSASTIEIDDFEENAVTANRTATTTYQIRNRYGEDITKRIAAQPECKISDPSVIRSATTGTGDAAGTLTLDALNQGTSEVTLSLPTDPSVNAKINVTVVEKAHIKEIRFGTMSIDDGLILDSTAILYIPVQAYDQYGNKYDVLTSGDVAAANLKITVNGKNASDFKLNAKWYKNVGERSPIAPTPDTTNKIGAIGLSWDTAGSTTAPSSGEILNINFTSNRDDFMAKSYQVPVNSPAIASRIELGSHVQAALPGAQVSNTVKLFDQYGTELTAVPAKQKIYFEVRDKNNKKIASKDLNDFSAPSSITSSNTLPAGINITINPTLQNTNKEYTILAYLGPDDSDPGYDDNKPPVGGSYKLLVDSADNLLEKIEISDTAVKTPISQDAKTNTSQEISLDSHYVNLTGSGTQLTFDCEMYTRYQGEDIKVAWKNSSSKPVFAANNLIWEVIAPDEVTVNVDSSATNIFTFKEASSSSSPIDDVATVSLTYMSDSKTLSAKERSIKVSNKPAMPQGEYQIINPIDTLTVNYLDKNNTAEISAKTTFKLVAEDQYGDTYDQTPLFTVISSKGLFSIDSILTFPTTSGSFAIQAATNTKVGDVDTIKVYVTKDDFYEFKVKYISSP